MRRGRYSEQAPAGCLQPREEAVSGESGGRRQTRAENCTASAGVEAEGLGLVVGCECCIQSQWWREERNVVRGTC